ncbi:hypothetical protein [Spiroplasma endosymbiont of Polydrusus formosus]|uniref:hypothetical protein n=1 Tax=Spiroplasma endosymbiont of Polydrusus formosus TaxID=3139326 RepID=UPI0035B53B44
MRQFIQTSAPGEGYCFPKITYDEKTNKGIVELDELLLKDPGVRAMAVKFYGNPIFLICQLLADQLLKVNLIKKLWILVIY